MDCANDLCICTSEVGVERDGRLFCSDYCVARAGGPSSLCECGHAGCASRDSGTALPVDLVE